MSKLVVDTKKNWVNEEKMHYYLVIEEGRHLKTRTEDVLLHCKRLGETASEAMCAFLVSM